MRKKGAKYAPDFGTISLEEVANIDHGHSREKPVPAEFIAADGMDVTPAFIKYIAPLARRNAEAFGARSARRAKGAEGCMKAPKVVKKK